MKNILDLFCGIGGFSLGFNDEYNIVAGVDSKESSINTFEKNLDAEGIKTDLSKTEPEEIDENIGEGIDIIIGGPPCKGFSIVNQRNKGHDNRNDLVNVFLDFVDYFDPTAVSMENVPQFRSEEYPTDEYGTYGDLVRERMSDMGYSYNIFVLNSARYGVPQKRKRAILLASKKNEPPEKPETNNSLDNAPTVGEAISDVIDADNEYYNHRSNTKERMNHVPKGGNWKDIPEEYRTDGMGKNTHNVYHRLNPNQPSKTVTNFGKDLTIHPDKNRMITVREGMLLQSYPDKFTFHKDVNKTQKIQHVANSIPPKLSESIAEQIDHHLKN